VKILVIEDDEPIAAIIRLGLGGAGYHVDVAADGPSGLEMAKAGGYSLVVLDLMLPGLDGMSICARLREAGNATPILMLTARDAMEDRVSGLLAGADDYLAKPFHFPELLARVHALLRRTVSHPVAAGAATAPGA
jgi:DNA-binding response OmpR family regulator